MDYRFDLLDKLKALSDEGKLDLAQYDGQTARDLGTSDFEKIHYSVSSSLQMPAAAYKLELAGRDLGDKGTRLFENSLMLAVEYINGRLRFVDGNVDGDASGSEDAVTKRSTTTAKAIDEDAMKAVLARLDAFETTTRRMDGRLASVQKTLSDEVRKSDEAAAHVADDGTSGELRIAIDMHDGETVLHDVAVILEKVTALQGTLEECAKGIAANAEGSSSCLSEIRSCSASIDNLLNVLYIDDNDGSSGDLYDGLGDDDDITSEDDEADDVPVASGTEGDAASTVVATDAVASDKDEAIGNDTMLADDAKPSDDDDDAKPSDDTDDAKPSGDDDGDMAMWDAPVEDDAADDGDGDDAASGDADGDGESELHAVPLMRSDDMRDDAGDVLDVGVGHLDSIDDIARKFAEQVSENLGVSPVRPYAAGMASAVAQTPHDAVDAFDDGDDNGYIDLFGDGFDGLPDDNAVDGAAGVVSTASSRESMARHDEDASDVIGEMDMSDFMSDVAFDGDAGPGASGVSLNDGDDSDGDDSLGLDGDLPDMSDVFDDLTSGGTSADGADDGGVAVVADDDNAGNITATVDAGDRITVPARKRRGSKARWNA